MVYRSQDGRVRVMRVIARAEFRRHAVRRGGKYVLWHAYDVEKKKWIARELGTLGATKDVLVAAGYCPSVKECHLRREK